MDQRVREDQDFPRDFDPTDGLIAYLRAHDASQWLRGLIVVFAILAAIVGQPVRVEPNVGPTGLKFDDGDEPLDDEDRAALEEARADENTIPLETYFERRFDRAS